MIVVCTVSVTFLSCLQDTNYAKERPKRAAPSKGKKGSGGGTKQSAKGKGSGAVSSSSQSSSSSSGGASGAGAPGGEPPGGGKGPGKEPPSSAVRRLNGILTETCSFHYRVSKFR